MVRNHHDACIADLRLPAVEQTEIYRFMKKLTAAAGTNERARVAFIDWHVQNDPAFKATLVSDVMSGDKDSSLLILVQRKHKRSLSNVGQTLKLFREKFCKVKEENYTSWELKNGNLAEAFMKRLEDN
eukprot:scaffold31996_cov19-Prasinocladus_malaysianus.AAC.1